MPCSGLQLIYNWRGGLVYLPAVSRYDGEQPESSDFEFHDAIGKVAEMSDAKVRGVVHLIEETKTYGQKGFRKRLVVLEQDNDRFTNYIPFDFIQDACDSVDELNVGDEVEITYRLAGRKWQKDAKSEVKFFLNAEATAFKVLGGKGSSTASKAPDDDSDPNAGLSEAAYDEEDIPF
jgi:hypothetical protein